MPTETLDAESTPAPIDPAEYTFTPIDTPEGRRFKAKHNTNGSAVLMTPNEVLLAQGIDPAPYPLVAEPKPRAQPEQANTPEPEKVSTTEAAAEAESGTFKLKRLNGRVENWHVKEVNDELVVVIRNRSEGGAITEMDIPRQLYDQIKDGDFIDETSIEHYYHDLQQATPRAEVAQPAAPAASKDSAEAKAPAENAPPFKPDGFMHTPDGDFYINLLENLSPQFDGEHMVRVRWQDVKDSERTGVSLVREDSFDIIGDTFEDVDDRRPEADWTLAEITADNHGQRAIARMVRQTPTGQTERFFAASKDSGGGWEEIDETAGTQPFAPNAFWAPAGSDEYEMVAVTGQPEVGVDGEKRFKVKRWVGPNVEDTEIAYVSEAELEKVGDIISLKDFSERFDEGPGRDWILDGISFDHAGAKIVVKVVRLGEDGQLFTKYLELSGRPGAEWQEIAPPGDNNDPTKIKVNSDPSKDVNAHGLEPGEPAEAKPRPPLDQELNDIIASGREALLGNQFYNQISSITERLFANAEQRGLTPEAAMGFVKAKISEIRGPRPEPKDAAVIPGEPGEAGSEPDDDILSGLDPDWDGRTATGNPNSGPENPKLVDAIANLWAAQQRLIFVSIDRKARSGDGLTSSRKRDKATYKRLMEDYKIDLHTYLQVKKEDMAARGKTEAQIQRELTRRLYQQQRLFASQELRRNQQRQYHNEHWADNENLATKLWAKRNVLVRKWADLSTKRKIAIGVVVGGGTAFASAGIGLGLAGLAAGSAAKFSLGLVQRASLRNVSEKSYRSTKENIRKAQKTGLANAELRAGLGGRDDLEDGSFIEGLVYRVEDEINGDIQAAQRRNRIGNTVLAASGLTMGLGLAGAEGVIPNLHVPRPNLSNIPHLDLKHLGLGHLGLGNSGAHHHVVNNAQHHHPGANHGYHAGSGGHHVPNPGPGEQTGNTRLDFSNFHPDSFKGVNGDDAVKHAFGVLQRNHMQIHGLTPEKIHQINLALAKEHFHIASGVNAQGHQNIVNWTSGSTANAKASALQGFEKVNGSSVGNWVKFVKVAQAHGVSVTQGKG